MYAAHLEQMTAGVRLHKGKKALSGIHTHTLKARHSLTRFTPEAHRHASTPRKQERHTQLFILNPYGVKYNT